MSTSFATTSSASRFLASRFFAAILTLLSLAMATRSVEATELSYYLPQDVTYAPEIPLPSATLGYEVGDWHVRHDQLVAYLQTLAAASPRIRIEETGRTHEGRPLLLLTVTSPDNLGRLDEIRTRHAQLTDPEHSDAVDISDLPVVCYLGYSIHGNEASGSNAALLVAYYLAAAQGEEIESILRDTVILLDPALNPDGLARFGEWANTYRGQEPVGDPDSRERDEAWPGGRTNHYWFDLNRDWLLAVHPESQARLVTYQRWKPNLLGDFHETSSRHTFFFQPGVPSRKNPLTPQRNVELTQRLASYHARALDAAGSLYFTEEVYDDYYYGKGSTYPDINGGIGILFEQATTSGQTIDLEQGERDFPFTIRNQFLVSLSTLRGARDLRTDLLSYQRSFYQDAWHGAPSSGWIFGDATDRTRTATLVELLLRHGIDVYRAAHGGDVEGTRYEPGSTFVVPRKQAQARLLEAMMETRTSFPDSVFYDVSTWTMPLAMGLPYASVSNARDWMGDKVETAPIPAGQVRVTDRGSLPVAFAFEWGEYLAPRALLELEREGIWARVATRPFAAQTAQGRTSFDFGTIVIPCGIQKATAAALWEAMDRIAQEDGVDVHAIVTGLTPAGIDLGSPSLRPVNPPSIAMLVGDGVSSTTAGTIWHLLDHKFGQPVSLLTLQPLSGAQLRRYTHLILPDGGYDRLGEAGKESLRRWVEEGGVLILVGSATTWAIDAGLIPGERRQDPMALVESPKPPRPYGQYGATQSARRISGAILWARLDRTHPLGFGFPRPRIAVFRDSRIFLSPDANPYGNVVQCTEAPLASGYVPSGDLPLIAGSASLMARREGRGAVISMVDEPDFRGFWYGTNKLFMNAVCFGAIIDRTGE
ncbi:MAG: zinc carboxypeptidase [Candidatus Eisenbacteria bacterium]|uniref:Zinc carboxypeptidase n=1 Tax=Eiseniibacteriota bacterium TaxID=2212470 RepID=A0A956RNB2_UNCEI|nr:zinc carboxypeptidase [Candidatus Eisenbacteria bacterium]